MKDKRKPTEVWLSNDDGFRRLVLSKMLDASTMLTIEPSKCKQPTFIFLKPIELKQLMLACRRQLERAK